MPATPAVPNPWNALWAMMVGFFMILVDSTIVAVANPSIMEKLQTDYDAVIWVTSAYLLAYAVPLLVAGRLGDQFGPKNLYLIGLAIFTAASLWCGLSGSIETLIAARVVQGIGVAPQAVLFFDDLEDNVEAARQAGLQGVHVRSAADVIERLAALPGDVAPRP